MHRPEITIANKATRHHGVLVEQGWGWRYRHTSPPPCVQTLPEICTVQNSHGRFQHLQKYLMVWAEKPKSPSERTMADEPDLAKNRRRRSVSRNNQGCTWTQPSVTRSCGKTERSRSPEASNSAMEIPSLGSVWGEEVSSVWGQWPSWPWQGLEWSSSEWSMANSASCGR